MPLKSKYLCGYLQYLGHLGIKAKRWLQIYFSLKQLNYFFKDKIVKIHTHSGQDLNRQIQCSVGEPSNFLEYSSQHMKNIKKAIQLSFKNVMHHAKFVWLQGRRETKAGGDTCPLLAAGRNPLIWGFLRLRPCKVPFLTFK